MSCRFETQLAEERSKAAAVRAENGVLRKRAEASGEAAAAEKRLAAENAAQRDALQKVAKSRARSKTLKVASTLSQEDLHAS